MSAEWKIVQRKQNRGNKQQNATTGILVKEILTALLANQAYQPKAREPEWKCKNCQFSNFATRYMWRECLKPRQTGRPNHLDSQPNVQ